MTWQGSGTPGDNAGDGPADDETRTDWSGPAGGTQDPIPAAPPPLPGPADAQPAQPATPQPGLPPPAPPPSPAGPPPAPGYGAPAGPATPPPGYGAQPPGYGAPQGAPVAWAPPSTAYAPTGLEVPGVPGLRFGSTLHRVLAYWIDGILVAIAATIVAGIAASAASGSTAIATLVSAVVYLGIEFLYFVGLWTSTSRATLGMRFMKLQIGNAFDGKTLTMTQAVTRWFALGLPFQAAGFVPQLAAIAGLAGLWTLVLLVSTAVSPTRQGVHDRIANSAIVQPIGASTPAAACLLLVLLLLVLPLIAIVALIFLGNQVSEILSAVGDSI
jgi:uncharacterized RDD family membrane protein YckC